MATWSVRTVGCNLRWRFVQPAEKVSQEELQPWNNTLELYLTWNSIETWMCLYRIFIKLMYHNNDTEKTAVLCTVFVHIVLQLEKFTIT